jgi:putative transposase
MDEYVNLSHTTWDCKYHVVFIPKCRRKSLYLELRRHLGEVFRKLALQKEARSEEGHLMPYHVHMLLSIPPKYTVSQVVGFIKGKSAIHLAVAPFQMSDVAAAVAFGTWQSAVEDRVTALTPKFRYVSLSSDQRKVLLHPARGSCAKSHRFG